MSPIVEYTTKAGITVLIFSASMLVVSFGRLMYNWCETHRHIYSIKRKEAASLERTYDLRNKRL